MLPGKGVLGTAVLCSKGGCIRGRHRHYDSDVIVRFTIHDAACSCTLLHRAEAATNVWVKRAGEYPYSMGLFIC